MMTSRHDSFSVSSRMSRRLIQISVIVLLLCLVMDARAQNTSHPRVDVRLVTDEAEAVLHILQKRMRQEEIGEQDWLRLQESEGYVRLKRRQESFGATDYDNRFRAYVTSGETLERLASLRQALDAWQSVAMDDAAQRALAYLPAGSRIHATIYPVIKHSSNSFVFELDSDPAIFLYVDPEPTVAELENTLAHELHHVGSTACDEPEGIDSLSAAASKVVNWLSAFGEGLAVLAAARGPNGSPALTLQSGA